jgi:hypothetical protein
MAEVFSGRAEHGDALREEDEQFAGRAKKAEYHG